MFIQQTGGPLKFPQSYSHWPSLSSIEAVASESKDTFYNRHMPLHGGVALCICRP